MMCCIFVRDRPDESKMWNQAHMLLCSLVDRPPAPSRRDPFLAACADRSLHSSGILWGDVLRDGFDFIASENARYCICMNGMRGTMDSVARECVNKNSKPTKKQNCIYQKLTLIYRNPCFGH